ncbi:hypothetical protein [Arthrobacter sp. UYEF20]|uniref:hypothetical protein n=1 Tax=Arthrobacter sp. UYEF20 TaxID=1756363 RepID=UPI003393187C
MRIEAVDERDSCWEQHAGRFCVYFFQGPGPGLAVSTFDVTDATFFEVMAWADNSAEGRMFSVALVAADERGKPGLIWLTGDDANDGPLEDGNGVQARLRAEMVQRS